jgi:hypothetical protein
MNATAAAEHLSSVEFVRLLSVYFRGLFFEPPAFETGGLHSVERGCFLEKEMFIPYLKGKGVLDLCKMASGKPFDSLFPPDARTKDGNGEPWQDIEKSLRQSKKLGGFIKVFIEKRDDRFINRAKAFLPDIARNDDFSIPEDFFACFADSGVFLYAEREDGNNIRNLRWDFERLMPPLAHALKPHKRAISVYDAYEWHGEKAYTSLTIGAVAFPEESCPHLLMRKGSEHCVDEIVTAYEDYIEQKYQKKASPAGKLIFAIYEMLETPHDSRKTVGEIKKMVFGGMKRRKNDNGPLLPQDIQNIKNAVKDIAAQLDEDRQKGLEAAKDKGMLETARELQRLSADPSLRLSIGAKRLATIEEISRKIEGELSLDAFSVDGEGFDIYDILEDKRQIPPEMEFLENQRNEIKTRFLKNDFAVLCIEGIAAEFEGEEAFIGYMGQKTWQETVDLLLPYATNSPNTGSLLYREYCRIRAIPALPQKEAKEFHTRFAKKIRAVFNYIRKETGNEIREALDGQ